MQYKQKKIGDPEKKAFDQEKKNFQERKSVDAILCYLELNRCLGTLMTFQKL